MKKIFFNKELFNLGTEIILANDRDSDYHHLVNVLRVKVGDVFIIGDKDNNEFIGKITQIDKNVLTFALKEYYQRMHVDFPEVTLFFSVLKSEKNEMIIQKCSELGVKNFVPVFTNNTVVKLNKNKDKKIHRWRKIAKEAAMQSLQKTLPEVHDFIQFKDIHNISCGGTKIFGYFSNSSKSIHSMLNGSVGEYCLFVGPEGDFTDKEVDLLIEWGWQNVVFSPYILRSETAAICLASMVFSYYYGVEDLNEKI